VPFMFSSRDPAKRKVENQQVKIAGSRSENTLISGGARRSLINKTSSREGAERELRNKTAGARDEV
jgi:hypothetical protein